MRMHLKCLLGFLVTFAMFVGNCCSCKKEAGVIEGKSKEEVVVPPDQGVDEDITKDLNTHVLIRGNSWVVNVPSNTQNPISEEALISLNQAMISDDGLKSWSKSNVIVRSFVRVEKTGKLSVGIKARQAHGKSVVRVSVGEESKEITLNNNELKLIPVGRFTIAQKGYVQIDLQGISKTDYNYGDVTEIVIGGEVISQDTYFVKDDYYWGRRGPSVHLGYQMPGSVTDIQYFYNEVTVPQGDDVIGSYYMANGFNAGYFGIQVNSATERRVLFSVWSPYKTDNPNDIPEEYRVKLLKKGQDVTINDFGNEGSGGQSYRKYNWKAGNTYRFLLKAAPSAEDYTDYTAYFYAPEIGKWELIASFRRPKGSTYLKGLYSFLENFSPNQGAVERKVLFGNQWVCDVNGNWTEVVTAKFTGDATARKNARLDYAGGLEGDGFFLRNCGFFSDKVNLDTMYSRESKGSAPNIDFSKLP